MSAGLFRSGERAPADLYRDVLNGPEIALQESGCLPGGPDGKETVYVHLTPSWAHRGSRRTGESMSHGSDAGPADTARTDAGAKPQPNDGFTGACGRTIFRPGGTVDGRLTLIMEPTNGKRNPCSRCRRDCPGQQADAAVAAKDRST